MAMTRGTVSIAVDGTASGTGFAKALFDDYLPKTGLPSTPDPTQPSVAARQQVADLCNSLSSVIDYVKANAQVAVTITTSTGGLQRVGGVDTDPPGADKTLSGTVT